VLEHLHAVGLLEHALAIPIPLEVRRLTQQLLHKRRELHVVAEAGAVEPQHVRDFLSQRLPLRVQLACGRIEYDPARNVAFLRRLARHDLVERRSGSIPSEHLAASPQGHRRRRLKCVEQPQESWPDLEVGRRGRLPSTRSIGQVLKVCPLRGPEPERIGEPIKDQMRGQDATLLQAAQVVRAHVGESRDLLTSQTRHPPLARIQ